MITIKKLIVLLAVIIFAAASSPVKASVNVKVSICHATESETNPYNKISVDVDGLNGHGDHGKDIIPPVGQFAGLNWDTQGQVIWANNCNLPGDKCPNLEGTQLAIPEGYTLIKCKCIKNEEPPKEEPPVATPSAEPKAPETPATITPTPKVPTLPNTGGGLEFLMLSFAVSGIGGLLKFAARKG